MILREGKKEGEEKYVIMVRMNNKDKYFVIEIFNIIYFKYIL